jgi:hypothetical protein
VTNDRHIVVAAEITADSPDFGHLGPMVSAAEPELDAAGLPIGRMSCSPAPVTGTGTKWR